MRTEEITQIIETIKTLNLNVDSESAIQIIETLKPVMYLYIGADILRDICFTILMLGIFLVVMRSLTKLTE